MLSKKMLTIEEVAEYLGCTVWGIERDLIWGHIPFHRVNGEVMFDPADFKYHLGVDYCAHCQLKGTMFCKHC
jgi:excisionase family DNA binding protein